MSCLKICVYGFQPSYQLEKYFIGGYEFYTVGEMNERQLKAMRGDSMPLMAMEAIDGH